MFFISVLAAVCSTIASIPQVLGRTNQLSNFTMVIRCTGAILWAIYGTVQLEYALLISSSIACLVELCLLFKTNCVGDPKGEGSTTTPSDT